MTGRLHDWKMYLNGARTAIRMMRDCGVKIHRGKEGEVYDRVLFECLMSDDRVLADWLAGVDLIYYGHKRDGKGKLTTFKIRTYDTE